MKEIYQIIAEELKTKDVYVKNVISLIDEGNTIPFIARYRKEMHGAMSDTDLRALADRLTYLRNLQERREAVKAAIEEQGKLTEELASAIDDAQTLAKLEDLYRPYKQKRRTRATVAREKGLEPLAAKLMLQTGAEPLVLAEEFIDEEKGVGSAEEALAGASDIIAEMLSDDADIRDALKKELRAHGIIESSAAKDEDSVYAQYYDFRQSYSKMAGHQTLAVNRGEKEGFLKVSLVCDEEKLKSIVRERIVTKKSPSEAILSAAAEDAFSRLIFPSIE